MQGSEERMEKRTPSEIPQESDCMGNCSEHKFMESLSCLKARELGCHTPHNPLLAPGW